MSKDIVNLDAIKSNLRRMIGGHRFAMWFSTCRFQVLHGLLIIAAPTSRMRDWIQRSYQANVEDVAKAAELRGVRVQTIDVADEMQEQTLFGEQA